MTMTANGLAKLLEECGELSQVAAKKLAYFHTDEHPDDAGSLQMRLENEIADVQAACLFVAHMFDLDLCAIREREKRKLQLFHKWHDEAGNNSEAVDRERNPK